MLVRMRIQHKSVVALFRPKLITPYCSAILRADGNKTEFSR